MKKPEPGKNPEIVIPEIAGKALDYLVSASQQYGLYDELNWKVGIPEMNLINKIRANWKPGVVIGINEFHELLKIFMPVDWDTRAFPGGIDMFIITHYGPFMTEQLRLMDYQDKPPPPDYRVSLVTPEFPTSVFWEDISSQADSDSWESLLGRANLAVNGIPTKEGSPELSELDIESLIASGDYNPYTHRAMQTGVDEIFESE
jgi:hypothetical protein